jgi:hypothetical protein
MAQEFEHATVLYRPGEARTFAKGETIPAKSEGWADEPFPPTDEELGLAQSDGSLIGFAGDPDANAEIARLTAELADERASRSALEELVSASVEAEQAAAEARRIEFEAVLAERDGLKIERDALKAQVAKFDKDGNGQPGGSKPKGA